MANPDSVLALAVATQADAASLQQLSRQTHKAVVDATTKAAKQTTTTMGRALEAAASGGLFTRGLLSAIRGSHKGISSSIAKAAMEGFKGGWGKAELWVTKQMSTQFSKMQRTRDASLKREMDRRKAAAQEIERFKQDELDERIRRTGGSLTGGAAAVVGGLQGGDMKALTDVLTGIGQGIRQRGRAAAAVGAGPDAGSMQKMVGMLGGAVAKIGTAVAAVGAAAGTMALVLKILLDVDAVAKDMNKTFLEAGGTINNALGGVARTGEEVEAQFRTMQNLMTDHTLVSQWHATKEEIQGVVSGLNQGGTTVRRLTRGVMGATDQMARLRDATELAMTYGQLFNMSSQEMAATMSRVSFETGTTLQRVAEGMQTIAEIARVSGFEVKRFYSAVLEATTGMGLYNVRIEMAAGLLKSLSTILGETVSGEFLKGIVTTFKDMAVPDKIKNAMLGGIQETMGLMMDDARKQTQAIGRDLQSMRQGTGAEQAQADAFERWFGSIDDMAARFARMSSEEFNKRVASARAAGVDAEILNQARRAHELARAGAGVRTAFALDVLDPASKLIMQLRSVERSLGVRVTDELSDVQMAAIEQVTGVTGDRLRQLRTFVGTAEGQLDVLKNLAKLAERQDLSAADQAILDRLQEQTNTVVENGKIFQAMRDETGMISANTDKQINTVEDLLKASEAFADFAQEANVREEIALARTTAKETKSVANVLKNQMLSVLLEIAQHTKGILSVVGTIAELISFFAGGERARDAQAREGARTRLELGAAYAREEAGRVSAAIAEMEEEMGKLGADDARKGSLKKRIDLLKEEREALLKNADAQDEVRRKVDTLSGQYRKSRDVIAAAAGGVGTKDTRLEGLEAAAEAQSYHAMKESGGKDWRISKRMAQVHSSLVAAFGEEKADKIMRRGMDAAESALISMPDGGKKAWETAAGRMGEEIARAASEVTAQEGGHTFGVEGVKDLVRTHGARARQLQDFVVTKRGEVVRTSPGDTIYATRGQGPGQGGGDVTVNIWGGDRRQVYDWVRDAIRTSRMVTT